MARFWTSFGVAWSDWDSLTMQDYEYMKAVVDRQIAEERAAERESRRAH